MDRKWGRDDWAVLVVLVILLVVLVAVGSGDPPTTWSEREFR